MTQHNTNVRIDVDHIEKEISDAAITIQRNVSGDKVVTIPIYRLIEVLQVEMARILEVK